MPHPVACEEALSLPPKSLARNLPRPATGPTAAGPPDDRSCARSSLATTASAAGAKCPCDGAKSDLSFTPFRMAEKRYKLYELSRRDARRQPPPPETDLTDVVHLHDLDRNTDENKRRIHRVFLPPGPRRKGCTAYSEAEEAEQGTETVCYTFAGVPGLLLFPGVLSEVEQQHWCREAVLEYGDSKHHPNILSTHAKAPQSTSCYQPPMRWATLGYSYDWTRKQYHPDSFSTFPFALRRRMCDLVSLVAEVRQDGFCCAYPDVYEPQTAIVNYFPVGSMMMCHQDTSEEALEQPLMSLSLGCSAIFLMGTHSREDAPYAFLLRSGDMVAFTGPSRMAFHSTPRILDDCPTYLTVPEDELTDMERDQYRQHAYYAHPTPDGSFSPVDKASMTAAARERYWRLCMRHMRININARQVYSKRCPRLFDTPHSLGDEVDTRADQ
ncbi:hypothetical protein LSCM1_05669 [Leishmania martiniquensis]|uniref:Alpha-ketoglutarate-dependent dioxygenase AlkB-like domain-containing protein n=1 Tax=Leishmania martiniquensis TaxID=1580590 RepID=A0A836KQM6_9TRYP|nr:hypothetical protein LSCM1_05669 [Leishmania martiniquensis]